MATNIYSGFSPCQDMFQVLCIIISLCPNNDYHYSYLKMRKLKPREITGL